VLSASSLGPNHGTSRSGAACRSFRSAALIEAPNFCCAIASSATCGLLGFSGPPESARRAPAANDRGATSISNAIAIAAPMVFRSINIQETTLQDDGRTGNISGVPEDATWLKRGTWRRADAEELNVEPAVGSTPPWAGVTPAPSDQNKMRDFVPVRSGLGDSALPHERAKRLCKGLLAPDAATNDRRRA
jgi:hypothetical protein